MTTTRERATLEIRAAATDTREITGIGVPYGETISIWGMRERLAPGSVEAEGAKLFYRHSEPIGLVTSADDTEAGWHPTAKISTTPRGDEAYQLARDGVLDGLSIGFDPVEWHTERDDDGTEVTVYTRVRVREVSLVPFPAYPSATVTDVRSAPDPTSPEGKPDMTDPTSADDLRELREQVQDVARSVTLLADRPADEPTADERSAGAWLRDLAAGDETTVRAYEDLVERAYTGGTSADGILNPQYVGDTIRLFNSPDPLSSIFATGVLPSKGLRLEYGVLESDNVEVDEQAAEGDDLTKGKLKVGIEHAAIKTFGGHVELTRQQIERTTNVNVLDLHLRALGLRGARRKATVLRNDYAAIVAENIVDPDRVVVVADQTEHLDWIEGIIDAAERFLDLGLPLDALVVDKSIFKTLAGLETANRPLMRVYGDSTDAVGRISAKTLGGDLAGVTVRVNLKQTTPGAAFVNGEAIRQYASSITELADENIVNLSKRFGLYYYAANAFEIPEAIVPVVATKPAALPEGD